IDKANNAGQPTASLSGTVKNFGAGANETIANIAGAPVDTAASLLKIPDITPEMQADFKARHPLAGQLLDAMGGWNKALSNPIGGNQTWKYLMGLAGANPDNIQPQNGIETAARAAGGAVPAMIAPLAGARTAVASGVAKAGPLMDTLANGSLAGNAAIGAVGGAGGQSAQDQVPDKYKPLANVAGNLIGGGAVAAPAAAGRALTNTAGFNARRADQQQAQVGALNSVQETGDPYAVGQFVRDQLGEINAAHDAA